MKTKSDPLSASGNTQHNVVNVDPVAFAVCTASMAAVIPWKLIGDHSGGSSSKKALYEELARFALISTQMYDQLVLTVTCDCKGDYLSDVDVKFAHFFAQAVVKYDANHFQALLLTLGKLTHELFQKTPKALGEAEPIIYHFTGYRSGENVSIPVTHSDQHTVHTYH